MTITKKKRGYWCLSVVYTLCQGLESDGRNFLPTIVHTERHLTKKLPKFEYLATLQYTHLHKPALNRSIRFIECSIIIE
jgi:hypothetical protein